VPDEYLTNRPRDVNLRLGSGWYPLEREANTNEFWRWSNANALVYATSVTSEKVSVKIRLRPFEIERTLQVQLNQQNVFQVKVPAGPPSTWQFELTLPAGRNELRLVSLEGDQNPGPQDKRRLAFAVHSVEIACLECGPQK